MEKKWQKRRERSARIKLFFKRVRLPLLTVGGTFLTAFIIIPLALGAYEARAESIEVTAPNKQAQPSAQVGDIQQYAPLVFEQRDEAVRALQQRLMDLYYMGSDETTDYYGPVTRDAVMSFQRAHHLKETGDADEQTQQILFSSAAQSYIINQGCSGEDVLTLQHELKELGYYGDKLNGYFGTATGRSLTQRPRPRLHQRPSPPKRLSRQKRPSPARLPRRTPQAAPPYRIAAPQLPRPRPRPPHPRQITAAEYRTS